jgi:NADP-dependent 3-hydroxy acid dehydrogenase YdfG
MSGTGQGRLAGKVAVVTGAARGIARATAKACEGSRPMSPGRRT